MSEGHPAPVSSERVPSSGHLSKSILAEQFLENRTAYLRYLGRFVACIDDRLDLFSDALLKFLSAQAQFETPQVANSYFYRTLHSVAVDYLRKSGRLIFLEEVPECAVVPEKGWCRRILVEEVADLAVKYSPNERRVLTVCLHPDLLRLKDKCRVLNRAPSTVGYHIRRLVDRLKEEISVPRRASAEGVNKEVCAETGRC